MAPLGKEFLDIAWRKKPMKVHYSYYDLKNKVGALSKHQNVFSSNGEAPLVILKLAFSRVTTIWR